MTAKELKRIFSKGECLSLDTMRLYNDGKLNKKVMHEVEKHLLECNLCSGAVDGLNSKRIVEINKLSAHIQRRLAVYMNTPPRVSFFRRFGLAIISGVLLLSAGGTWWYLQDHKKNAPQLSDTTQAKKSPEKSSSINEPVINVSMPQNDQGNTTNFFPDPGMPVAENKTENPVAKTENLPSNLPGQANVIPQKQEPASQPATNPTPDNTTGSPTTRTASESQPVRVKSVLVYPPVSHNDKQGRKEAKDGQLGKPGSSDAGFKMDEMPTFPGGDAALRNFILTNFKPTAADRSKLTRYATGVMFVVNAKTGAISSPGLSFSISPDIDKELLRVINTLPNYSPGKKRGEVDIMIGITFE